MSDCYWNEEDDGMIVCPYCGIIVKPSYDETYIGDVCVDCYNEGKEQTVTCDGCSKKFTIEPHLVWRYKTETIDEEMTEQEHE